jgi:hypothetical protein
MIGRASRIPGLLPLAVMWIAAEARGADEKPADPVSVKYRIVGLFSPERQEDLRQAAKKMVDVTLVDVDYAAGEVTLSYDPAKMLKGAKPEQVQNHLENLLKNASNHTFGLKPLCALPREKLQRVEIAVGVLDCKACGYGLYLAVMNVPGVEQALADYKQGLVTAWIDPEKTDRSKLVEALKKREVRLR